jgi:hypothetical protein
VSPVQLFITLLSDQREWARKVKKESSEKRAKALQDRAEAQMEAEMVRIWDQEETRTPKRPRTNASYAACYNPPSPEKPGLTNRNE